MGISILSILLPQHDISSKTLKLYFSKWWNGWGESSNDWGESRLICSTAMYSVSDNLVILHFIINFLHCPYQPIALKLQRAAHFSDSSTNMNTCNIIIVINHNYTLRTFCFLSVRQRWCNLLIKYGISNCWWTWLLECNYNTMTILWSMIETEHFLHVS